MMQGTSVVAVAALNFCLSSNTPLVDQVPKHPIVRALHATADIPFWYGFPQTGFGTAAQRTPAEIGVFSSGNRPTTERESIIGTLRDWTQFSENWDGEGASAPMLASLVQASEFVCLLQDASLLPEPMLHASGRAGLYWNTNGLYADLEFLGDGRVTYYIEHAGKDKHKGVVAFRKDQMPAVFTALLVA